MKNMPRPSTDLTGNTKFRRTLFGRLVLTVEYMRGQDETITGNMLAWRDAREGDLGFLRILRKSEFVI